MTMINETYGPDIMVSSLTNRPLEGKEEIKVPSFFCTSCNVKFAHPVQAIEHFLKSKVHQQEAMLYKKGSAVSNIFSFNIIYIIHIILMLIN